MEIPDKESEQRKVTVTFDVYRPDPFGRRRGRFCDCRRRLVDVERNAAGGGVAGIIGGCGRNNLFRAFGGYGLRQRQVATPESASPQTNVTVTFVLFQPAALAEARWSRKMVGGVVSVSKVCAVTVLSYQNDRKL